MKLKPLLGALVLLTACSYDVVKSRTSTGPGALDTPGSQASFDQVLKTALATNCTGCHAEFNVYENVFAARDQIAARVQSRDMPRGRTMPEDQRQLLLDWLAANAPRGTTSPSGPQTPGTPAPTPAPCRNDDESNLGRRHDEGHCEDHFSLEET